ncbi:MAG: hypothetical protein B6D64_14750 [Bacteroidetes bacterium 4484_276]|nr:MAG: hypothetical protein B6D64_14750 [Bacteroidetes bacterium 4484_276]
MTNNRFLLIINDIITIEVADGVSVVINGNDKGKTAGINYGSSGNSRRHTVNNRFNDANKGEVLRIDNDSSGNSRQRTGINDANGTYSFNIDGAATKIDRNSSGKSRQAIITENRDSDERLNK